LAAPFAYFQAGLDSLRTGVAEDVLKRSAAVFVGTRDYHPPVGLGAVRSKFCYLVVLRQRNELDLSRYMSGASMLPGEIPSWSWSAKLREYGENDSRPSTLFASQVGASYVLISNDRGDLETLASRLTSNHDSAKELAAIREWRSFSAHPVWGYRRYRHNDDDPVAAGTKDVTEAVEALLFVVDEEKKGATLRLFTAKDDDVTPNRFNQKRWKLRAWKVIEPGVWETQILLAGNQKSSEGLFDAMFLLGFGVYL
jgi:hypothetical protein